MLSTLFGDDVPPNGTPINFDEEDLEFPKRQGGQENVVVVEVKSQSYCARGCVIRRRELYSTVT